MRSFLQPFLFAPLIAVLAGLITTSDSWAFTSPQLVAAEGDPIGGTGLNLDTAGPPAVDQLADVAFLAKVTGPGVTSANNSAILQYDGTNNVFIIRTGTEDLLTGGIYKKFSDPVISGSDVMAFIGTLKIGPGVTSTNDQAIYVDNDGVFGIAVRKGDIDSTDFTDSADAAVPVSYDSFSEINVDDLGGLYFLANVRGKHLSTRGLFGTLLDGNLQVVVNVGDPNSPSGTDTFNALQPLNFVDGQGRSISSVNGNVVIDGKLSEPIEQAGVILNGDTGYDRFVSFQAGGDSPYNNIEIKSFDEPAISADASQAVKMTLKGPGVTAGNDSAIALSDTGGADSFVLSIRTRDTATDVDGNATNLIYTRFGDPVINNLDSIAFIGTLKVDHANGVTASNNSGIWSNWNGTMEEVARTGDAAPNTSGTFSAFKQLVLPDDNGPIFEARLSGVPSSANTGVWQATSGQILASIIVTGQNLEVHGVTKTVKSFSIFPVVPYCGDQSRFDPASRRVVFQVTFTDKTWAIFNWPPQA